MTPLKSLLDVAPDEQAMRAGWDAIAVRLPGPRRRAPRGRWLVGAAMAAVAVVVAIVVLRGGGDAARPLALADGRPLPGELVTDTRLSDGSEIAITDGRLEVIESDARSARWLLAHGSARFSVHPGGPRRWLIDAGAAQIEVIGTVFTVDRTPASVTVAVEHGIVLVRGEHVPGLVRRLQAGEQLRVPAPITAGTPAPPSAPPPGVSPSASPTSASLSAPPTSAPPTSAPPTSAPPTSASLSASPTSASLSPSPTSPPTSASPSASPTNASSPGAPTSASPPGAALPAPARLASGAPPRPAGASPTLAAPPAQSVRATPRMQPGAAEHPHSAQAALAEADELRRRGDLAGAVAVLGKIDAAPDDPLVAMAWFTRARISLELGQRAAAIGDLERAIAAGLPDALEARARARLDELTQRTAP